MGPHNRQVKHLCAAIATNAGAVSMVGGKHSPRMEVGPKKKAKYFQKNYKKKHILTDFRPKKKLQKKVHLD